MLVCYARELKEGFAAYSEDVVKIMVPLLKFYFNDSILHCLPIQNMHRHDDLLHQIPKGQDLHELHEWHMPQSLAFWGSAHINRSKSKCHFYGAKNKLV